MGRSPANPWGAVIMRILLLGSSGFLGSHLRSLLTSQTPFEIVAPSRQEIASFGGNGVALGALAIAEITRPDVVINCIANTSWLDCEASPPRTAAVNVELPSILGRELPKSVHLIHFSSDAVFGNGEAPYAPSNKTSPRTVYGRQKARADSELLATSKSVTIIRGSFFGDSKAGKPGIFNFYLDALMQGRAVDGYVDYVNSMISTYAISDVVLRCIQLGPMGLLHIGSSEQFSKYEFGVLVAGVFGFDGELVHPVASPSESVAYGGLNLSLDSASSWSRLDMTPPKLTTQLSHLLENLA